MTKAETGALPLPVQLSPFSNSSGAYRVNVSAEIPASLLERKWEGIRLRTSIAILGLVYDKNNVLISRCDSACYLSDLVAINGPVPADNTPDPWFSAFQKRVESSSIPANYQTQLELEPGDYRLELVIPDGQKFGRATASFRLADVVKDRLAISEIALCKRYRPASAEPRSPSQAPQYVPLVFNGTEFTPAGDTRVHKGEQFSSFFEIYGPHLDDTAATMHLQVRIADAKTGEIKLDSGSQPLKVSTPPKNHSAAVVREVSTDALPPGAYHLEAQVSDAEGQ